MLCVTLVVAAVKLPASQAPRADTAAIPVVCGEAPAAPYAMAIFPLRGGLKGEGWQIEDVLATGSRSPVPRDAPRITITAASEKSGTPQLILNWREGERFGKVYQTGATGLLTSPSTRFTPGLVAATDIAATALRKPFGAGRPAIVMQGTLEELAWHKAIWEKKAALLPYLVLAPWLLSLVLIIAAWRGGGVENQRGFGVLALVLWADLLLGSPLLDRLPFSYSVTEAARFYGIGNDAAGLLIGCALAAGFDIPVLLAVAVAIGAPSLGANNGCFLAMLVGIVGQEILKLPEKRRLAAALVALLGIGLLFFGLARWDVSRGQENRTHLGQAVVGGRVGSLALIKRKLAMNGHLLVSSPWSLLLLTSGVVLVRRRRWGVLIAGGAALALNDSGVLASATLLFPSALQKKQSPLPREEAEG